jgi:hypothetical protein
MVKQKILEKRKMRKRWHTTRSPQDKANQNKAVKELEQRKTKGHPNLSGKPDSHRILIMESHQKTKAATNTQPTTMNQQGRMGK